MGPLTGTTVVDLSRALAGPYATLMLADAGADVIKIERPGRGDESRSWGPPFAGEGTEKQSAYFLAVNRNKRSVTLDLKDNADAGTLRALIARADVLVENFRPGVMERLGLGEAELSALNPRLIVLQITGFGQTGPDRDRAGFDQIVQGEAGLMSITGPREGGPAKVGLPIADTLAGMFGAFGVAAALAERERSGRGQYVRTSLLAGAVAVHTFQGTRWLVAGERPAREGNRHPLIAPYGTFECADGPINIAVGSDRLWRRFAAVVGLDPDDPRYATNEERVGRADGLEAEINAVLRTGAAQTWLTFLHTAGVPAGSVRSIDQVYDSAQVQANDLIDIVEHPTLGTVRLPGYPLSYSRSQRAPSSPPPLLGQHSEEMRVALATELTPDEELTR
jgi:crotonobetainyl-CoA:carnitine CoA-transferase CaiB-like acyl-CoA transferase